MVLQYNPNNKTASLCKGIFVKEPCSLLAKIRNKNGLSFAGSLDNIIPTIDHKKRVVNRRLNDIVDSQNNNLYGFRGQFISTFNYCGSGIPLSDNEIRLMLAVIADGSFRTKHTNYCVVSIKKQRKIDEMYNILNALGVEYNVYHVCNGFTRFVFYAPVKEKEFNEHWYNCSRAQFDIICENVIKWDGHTHQLESGLYKNEFISTSTKSIDFVQFAYSCTGIRANIGLSHKEDKEKFCYRVFVCNRPLVGIGGRHKSNFVIEPSVDGNKYNFITDTGYFVARHDGNIYISGAYDLVIQ